MICLIFSDTKNVVRFFPTKKTQNKKHQRPARPYCCERLISDKSTYDHRIRHTVELLKYIPDKNRQCKA